MPQTSPEPEHEPIPDTMPAPPPYDMPTNPSFAPPPPVPIQSRPNWQAGLSRQIESGQQGLINWFYAAGSQIFGLLTLASIVLSLDLILLGYVDRASLVSGLAVAIALPFNLVGLWLAYYLKDASQANPAPAKKQAIDSTAFVALIAGTFFTLVSLGSAFWRVSWVATVLFLVAIIIGLWLILRVARHPA